MRTSLLLVVLSALLPFATLSLLGERGGRGEVGRSAERLGEREGDGVAGIDSLLGVVGLIVVVGTEAGVLVLVVVVVGCDGVDVGVGDTDI